MMKRLVIFTALLASPQANAIGLCWPACSEATSISRNQAFITSTGIGLFAFDTQNDLLQKAAETKLARGFTKFVIHNMNGGVMGVPSNFQAYRVGGWTNGYVNSRKVGQSSATITMFRDNDPGAAGALDARAILAGGD